MANTLLFIPDISGFTKFVNHTEVQHGQHVISELLEILIDSNHLHLKLSEIEGDALLFYKQGDELPSTADIVEQARTMFLNFHQHLKKYQNYRICQCGACRTAGNLTLKFVVHRGPIEFIKVKEHLKPYGSDVILAHRLLKNPIENGEYLLLSESMVKASQDLDNIPGSWLQFQEGLVHYDSIGQVRYVYGLLGSLHDQVPKLNDQPTALKIATPIIVETIIHKNKNEVFETIIDFERRMQWNKFAKDITYDDVINKVGSKHVCVFDTNSIEFETVSNDFGANSLVYGEKVLSLPAFAKDITIYFIVTQQDEHSLVKLAVHYQLKGLLGWVVKPFFNYSTRKTNKQVLANLKFYCEDQLTEE